MLPCQAQCLPAAVDLTVSVMLPCLLCVLQSKREPVMACVVAIVCEFVLDALHELRELVVDVQLRVKVRPTARNQVTTLNVFERVSDTRSQGRDGPEFDLRSGLDGYARRGLSEQVELPVGIQ